MCIYPSATSHLLNEFVVPENIDELLVSIEDNGAMGRNIDFPKTNRLYIGDQSMADYLMFFGYYSPPVFLETGGLTPSEKSLKIVEWGMSKFNEADGGVNTYRVFSGTMSFLCMVLKCAFFNLYFDIGYDFNQYYSKISKFLQKCLESNFFEIGLNEEILLHDRIKAANFLALYSVLYPNDALCSQYDLISLSDSIVASSLNEINEDGSFPCFYGSKLSDSGISCMVAIELSYYYDISFYLSNIQADLETHFQIFYNWLKNDVIHDNGEVDYSENFLTGLYPLKTSNRITDKIVPHAPVNQLIFLKWMELKTWDTGNLYNLVYNYYRTIGFRYKKIKLAPGETLSLQLGILQYPSEEKKLKIKLMPYESKVTNDTCYVNFT